jgi:hypothetical protein
MSMACSVSPGRRALTAQDGEGLDLDEVTVRYEAGYADSVGIPYGRQQFFWLSTSSGGGSCVPWKLPSFELCGGLHPPMGTTRKDRAGGLDRLPAAVPGGHKEAPARIQGLKREATGSPRWGTGEPR